jgi:hypothetical protein
MLGLKEAAGMDLHRVVTLNHELGLLACALMALLVRGPKT